MSYFTEVSIQLNLEGLIKQKKFFVWSHVVLHHVLGSFHKACQLMARLLNEGCVRKRDRKWLECIWCLSTARRYVYFFMWQHITKKRSTFCIILKTDRRNLGGCKTRNHQGCSEAYWSAIGLGETQSCHLCLASLPYRSAKYLGT